MDNIDEIIKSSKIEGNLLILPPTQLDRNTYLAVAKKLQFIGGKWNRGKGGFIFSTDPKELLPAIFGVKNIKKDLQFFETPEDVCNYLLTFVPTAPKDILEPSAGRGAIVRALNLQFPKANIDYCEISSINRKMFKGNANFIGEDFLKLTSPKQYDAIIANPPFAKNQDIEHFYKMYEVCKLGGYILSIMSNHWKLAENKKETSFRKFLEEKNAEVFDIEQGAFKDSGTLVSSCIVRLIKP